MTWASQMQALNDNAEGVLELHVVRPKDGAMLLIQAFGGDRESQRLLGWVRHVLRQVAAAPRRKPMLCASCPRPLRERDGFAVVIAVPGGINPEHCLTMGVCARCATAPDLIREKVLGSLRKLWPDLRPFEITHNEAGHA